MPALGSISQITGFTHPYLEVLPKHQWTWGWQEGSAIGALFAGKRSPSLVLLGGPADALSLILSKGLDLAPSCRITVPRRHEKLLKNVTVTEISEWDWMGIFNDEHCYAPTIEVTDLGLTHDEEIAAFLSQASPTASTPPGDPEIITWHGIRDANGLLAVGAATKWSSGAAVLVSIATHPRARGRGLAVEVTASLTRFLFDQGHHRVTLGLYAGNEAAAKTYTKVGYRLLEQFSSGSTLITP